MFGIKRNQWRRGLLCLIATAFALQVVVMATHHIAHGSSAAINVTAHAEHDHGQNADHTPSNTNSGGQTLCPFWLALHGAAPSVPLPAMLPAALPVAHYLAVSVEAPITPPQHLLTDLNPRGPPLHV